MNKLDNQSLICDLISLAEADGKLTHSEYDFILRLAKRMDVSEEEVAWLFKNPIHSKTKYSELERITHFHKLVLLMNVDRETHRKEVIAIKNFGLKMGIRSDVINQILDRMNDYDDKVIPTAELIQIFRSNYN
jgi:uncharacterized tellurite resistance protein B-like protein